MTRQKICVLIIISTLLLVSCWDQRLLKEHKLILAIGYDLGKDGHIKKTVSFPNEMVGDPQQISSTEKSEVLTTTGDTVKDAENKMEQYISGQFDRSKSKVIFLGEKLAKKGVYSTLNSLYRDLRGPLNASVAVINGDAAEALNIKGTHSLLTSDFYFRLIESADKSGIILKKTIQSASPVILTEGEDLILPYIKVSDKGKTAKIQGTALFSGDKLTGKLNLKETAMLLILLKQAPKRTKINLQIVSDKKKHDQNYVDFSIHRIKRKINITTNENNVKVDINIPLEIVIDEYSNKSLGSEQHGISLENKIADELDSLASKTIKKIQKANNDSLKIGQQVRAYHSNTWSNIDWKDVYPDIPINVTFDVELIRHGISD